MFSIALGFFIFQLTISVVLFYGYKKSKQFKALVNYENTTVIVPFKNEAKRISPLLDSINNAAILHKDSELFTKFQFIFIDDHSTDSSTQAILDGLDIKFQIVRLRTTRGKKYAIKKGVELAIFERILTLDADISFETQYLETIAKTNCEGLTILPVNMTSKSIIQQLFSVEFWFLQRLTFGLAGFNKYALCNGANLLFTKSAFNQALNIRIDADQKSGDDIFLLKAVNELKLPIQAVNQENVTVSTTPPNNLIELLLQRKRWLKKMIDLPSFIGGSFIVISNGFLVYSLFAITQLNYNFFIPIALKVCSELLSVTGIRKKLATLLHQITYPIYLVILLVSLPFGSEKWRN